jgi:formimidoylglutamate deiminase
LLQLACAGGAQASGQAIATIAVGQRADFVVLDTSHPLLCERHQDEILDSWIFSGNQNTISDVFVAGSHLIKQSRHAQQTRINADFRTAMQQLKATF